ncbi:MAG: helix-turn-helix transcriptional regulator, partial [Lachnospiraceae bacterium]|nr:helix-turn-helix transcriptional regulator [Lachnospiraceae bacterium]
KWCNELIKIHGGEERVDYVAALYRKEIEDGHVESEVNQIVRRIKQIVEENYARPECNVAWIADKVHMTSGYIGRIFKKYSGIGLMEYTTELRLKQACTFLKTENCSIAEVAQKVGYADSNYFTKLFRNKLGMSPSEYRRKKQSLYEKNL